ncbi:MAG TPA: bestrophin family protein [Phnomibacter sp.]|nr:bestrophin family protein [Phnomibacter sp.]
MVYYNPKDWFKPLIEFHKADTFRKLMPLLCIIAVYTAIVAYLEVHYLKLSDEAYLKNIPMMHQLLGFAISMLLVFRTNSAYDRWWEGRKLWGSLVNNCRNLAIKLDAILAEDDFDNRNYFRKIIGLFPKEMQFHLQKETTRYALDEAEHPELQGFDRASHMPAQFSNALQKRIQVLYKNNTITGDQLITLNAELQSFMDICGACERIKNTPIPYSYSAFIKKFIAVYVITLPLGFGISLGWVAVPVVGFIFYVLASLELIAEEIEDPFGNDTNDLPMAKISENIRNNVYGIIALPGKRG